MRDCPSNPSSPSFLMSMFREQLNTISAWFDQWNDCEQTVALYSLLKRLAPSQAHFLAVALSHSLADCSQLRALEAQANNPAFVSSLANESKEVALRQLLIHLPLLRPGNSEVKPRYLTVIPSVLGQSVEKGTHVEEARQLLSYSLIHPAITCEERRSLTHWLPHLEERITNGVSNQGSPKHNSWQPGQALFPPQLSSTNGPHHRQQHHGQHHLVPQASGPSAPSTSPPSQGVGFSNGYHPRVRRSNSLTPPVSIPNSADLWSSQDDLCGSSLGGRQKTRSFSLSSEHAPLSPQSSLASSGSGSESHLDEYRAAGSAMAVGGSVPPGSAGNCSSTEQDSSVMRDVGAWLKSLRLHKYVSLFARLSYEEMLSLTEERLASEGVTKGARHKIVLSIRKLRERPSTLKYLEEEVTRGRSIRYALEELKSMACTPIKPSSGMEADKTDYGETCNGMEEENQCGDDNKAGAIEPKNAADSDVPHLFTRVMGKVCAQLLLVSGRHSSSEQVVEVACPETTIEGGSVGTVAIGESAWLFVSLAERCIAHRAFSSELKQRLTLWKLQVAETCRPLIPPRPTPRPNTSSSSSTSCCSTVSAAPSTVTLASSSEMRHLTSRPKWSHPFNTYHSEFPLGVNCCGGSVGTACRPRFCQRSCSGGGGKMPFPLLGSGKARAASPNHPIVQYQHPSGMLATASAPTSNSSSPSSSSPQSIPQGEAPPANCGMASMELTASSVFLSKRPSLQDSLLAEPSSMSHTTLQRTKSAPPKPNYFCAGGSGNKVAEESCHIDYGGCTLSGESVAGHDDPAVVPTDPEINSRLESLCLSMTEHALGGI